MKKLLLFSALLFWFGNLFAQANFIRQDTAYARAQNCTNGISICIDSFTFDSINSLRFFLDGRQFSSDFTPCFIDTIHNYGYSDIFRGTERGPWRLDSWSVNGLLYSGQFASLEALTDSMRRWDSSGNWTLAAAASIIYGRAMGGRVYTCQQITGLTRNGRTEVCYNTGLEYRGLRFTIPPGVHQLIVEKVSTGQRDTISLVAACIASDVVRQTIQLGSSQTYCMDTAQLLGRAGALVNYCARVTTKVNFDAPATACMRLTGLAIGIDTACLRICDQYGICDTTILIVTVEQSPRRLTVIRDTIRIGLTRTNRGISLPTGTITSFENYCAGNSGQNVSFTLNSDRTVSYTGLTEGVDTVCIRVCVGTVCDSTLVIVEAKPVVIPPRLTRHIFRDTITIGLAGRLKCSFDAPANATVFENLCPSSGDMNISFMVNPTTKCVTYRGLTVGVDTACLRVCNASGECDTTYMYVEALPLALTFNHTFSDTISIGRNRVKCDLAAPANPTRIRNICEPQSGSNVDFMLNTTTRCVDYMGVTNGIDTACIEICNAAGICDTTTMYITAIPPQILRGRLIVDSIIVRVNEAKQYCADSSRVGSNFLRQFYATNPLYSVVNPIDAVGRPTACLSIRGSLVGRDTVNMVLTGNGISDTARLIIIVRSAAILPTTSSDTISLKIFETKTYCPDSSELAGSPIRYIAFCSTDPFDNTNVSLDTVRKCVNVRGLTQGQDTFCLIMCNFAGFCDTTKLFVKVSRDTLPPTIKLDSVRLFVGDSTLYCGIDTLEIRGRVDSIRNYCIAASGTNSSVQISATNCLKIKGLRAGIDTACIVVCNTASRICDTTRIIIRVQTRQIDPPRPSTDTVRIAIGELKVYCLDTTELRGSPVASINFCTADNFDNARIGLNSVTKCVDVRGTATGRDTTCIVICNAAGTCDTTYLHVIVSSDSIKPTLRTDIININLNQDTLYCGVDTSQIRGSVDSIYDACPGRNGSRARMILNPDTRCVSIRGVSVGSDTMCLVVFNRTSGLRDTTIVVVNVRNNQTIRLIANDDFDSLRRGNTKEFMLYANDTISRTPTSLTIISPPRRGMVDTISFQRGIVVYKAGTAFSACGLDTFAYRVCIDSTCDTAEVIVYVVCGDSLRVFNAISPNGDGKNDVLIIEGLNNFPNHTVCIFNRWGNEVLKTKGYQNDWGGKWNGKDLPDGTYFYWIRDDEKGEILKTGYLQIMK